MKAAGTALQSILYGSNAWERYNLFTFWLPVQRTNFCTFSAQLDNAAWIKGHVTITADSTVAPDGTTTADTITEDTANSGHSVLGANIVTSPFGAPYTVSAYVKAGTKTTAWVALGSGILTSRSVGFDLVAGTVVRTGTSVLASSITPLSNGWFRLSATVPGSGVTERAGVGPSDYGNYLGTSQTIFVWGVQVEAGPAVTSYIPTAATAASTGVLCLTDAAQDISAISQATGFQTFAHAGQNVRRTRSRISSDGTVDAAEVTIEMGTLAGLGLPLQALLGTFDGARCSVEKVYVTGSYADTSAGTVLDVDGTVVPMDINSTSLRLAVRSYWDRLAEPLPKRLVQVSCPYAVYESHTCKAVKASFTDHLTVAAGTTALAINTTAAPVHANNIGWVTFTSGPNAGLSRPIRTVAGSTITLTLALPYAPATGDTLDAFTGCDKTRATCIGTFSNLVNFGGFADSPPATMGG